MNPLALLPCHLLARWLWCMAWVLACGTVGATTPLAVPEGATALDVTGSVTYWVDKTGQMAVQDIANADATGSLALLPSSASQVHRLGHGALWQKLVLAPLPPGQRWFLQFNFHGVDWVSLYRQDGEGQWVGRHAGDHVAVAAWPIRERIPVFALQGDGVPRTYWLRTANHPIPVAAQLRLLRDDELNIWRQNSYLLLGAYFGLALLLVYLGAMNARQYQDRSFAIYAVYVGAMALIQLSSLGIGGMLLWPGAPWWNDAAPYVFSMLSCTAGTLLVREVCGIRRLSRRVDKAVLGWALFGVVWGTLYVSLPGSASFVVVAIYQTLTLPLVIGLALWSYRQGERWGLWMALCFAPVVLTAPFPSLRNYGVLPASFLTHYALAIGAAMEVPILLWVLSRRARDMTEARVRAQAMDSRDPLTGLTPSHVLLFRFREALVRARRSHKSCALLGVDLANYAEILGTHGREMAERALVVSGARLKSVANDVNTVARIDTHRFAILMEGPVDALEVTAASTQIVARGLTPSAKLPGGVTLKFHVAGLVVPEENAPDDHDAAACLKRVSDALDSLPADGRKAIVHLNY